jgi:hypothetical protein
MAFTRVPRGSRALSSNVVVTLFLVLEPKSALLRGDHVTSSARVGQRRDLEPAEADGAIQALGIADDAPQRSAVRHAVELSGDDDEAHATRS